MARAKTSPCPAKIAPQLVTLANTPPRGEWLYEIKFDGYRMMASSIRTSGSLRATASTGPRAHAPSGHRIGNTESRLGLD